MGKRATAAEKLDEASPTAERALRTALRERDRVALAAGKRIEELKNLLRERDPYLEKLEHQVLWYEGKLRELSLNQYTYGEQLERIRGLESEEQKLTADRDRILSDLNRIRRYSPDQLPKVLAIPCKAVLAGLILSLAGFRKLIHTFYKSH